MDVTAEARAIRSPGERLIPGRIELVTDSPVLMPHPERLGPRLEEELSRRPWVLPALLLVIFALLAVRRTR